MTCDNQGNYLASAAKRRKAEVKLKDLNPKEMELSKQAKEKEISSGLATDTVRRILRNKVSEGQLLRSRWVLETPIKRRTRLQKECEGKVGHLGI